MMLLSTVETPILWKIIANKVKSTKKLAWTIRYGVELLPSYLSTSIIRCPKNSKAKTIQKAITVFDEILLFSIFN